MSTPGSLDFILCRFGAAPLTVEPALGSFKRYFPEARVVLYTDDKNLGYPDGIDEIREVTPPYERGHKRYGWRSSDLYRAVGLLESAAEIAIYADSDMHFCSDKVRTLPVLARGFAFCLPLNPRLLVRRDLLIGADTDGKLDDSQGCGTAYNTALAAFHTASEAARRYLERYVRLMTEQPGRNPVAFYRAARETGFSPYALSFQWCVCEDHIGIGDEIVLHVGHRRVREYYFGKGPRWLKELRRLAFVLKGMYFPGKKTRAAVDYWSFP